MSVLADHRADPGDDVPAAPSARADDDLAATSIDTALDGATRIAPASDVDPGPAEPPAVRSGPISCVPTSVPTSKPITSGSSPSSTPSR